MQNKITQMQERLTVIFRDAYISLRYDDQQLSALSELAVMYHEVIDLETDLQEPAYLNIPHILILRPSALKSMIDVYTDSLLNLLHSEIDRANNAVRNTRRAKENPVRHIVNKANAAAQIEADKARIAEKGLDDFQREFVEGAAAESTYLFFGVETGDYADLERTIQAAEKNF
jgi:hypothetical protein